MSPYCLCHLLYLFFVIIETFCLRSVLKNLFLVHKFLVCRQVLSLIVVHGRGLRFKKFLLRLLLLLIFFVALNLMNRLIFVNLHNSFSFLIFKLDFFYCHHSKSFLKFLRKKQIINLYY